MKSCGSISLRDVSAPYTLTVRIESARNAPQSRRGCARLGRGSCRRRRWARGESRSRRKGASRTRGSTRLDGTDLKREKHAIECGLTIRACVSLWPYLGARRLDVVPSDDHLRRYISRAGESHYTIDVAHTSTPASAEDGEEGTAHSSDTREVLTVYNETSRRGESITSKRCIRLVCIDGIYHHSVKRRPPNVMGISPTSGEVTVRLGRARGNIMVHIEASRLRELITTYFLRIDTPPTPNPNWR
ncbi:hypothetical protein SCHPADRAFT_763577 [Schizopora paradoxa]|uniref:Uncharacterized protein n=1 Tax=Schizopora paradoxa TaxID=27342 RepID=A0A0H2QXF9_9AGAM|nr:hypothetical protein SCHPADRAFT_763577 [Schizopora paradoxa]